MSWFKKINCKHEWKQHASKTYVKKDRYTETQIDEFTIDVMVCQKCGKIKKITY